MMLKQAFLIFLCLALLLGLLSAALDRHKALRCARLERFSSIAPGVRYRNGACMLPVSGHAARLILHRIFGGCYLRIVP